MDDDDEDDYYPPMDDSGPDAYVTQDGSNTFYPPVMDDDDEMLQREEYIGEDEAETMKRVVWDKLFRGGEKAMSRSSRFTKSLRGRPDRKLVSAIMLFFFSAFFLLAFKGELNWQGFMLSAVVPLLIYIATMWLPRFFPADKLLLSIANFLCALGVLVLYSTDLIKGTNYGMQQAVYYGAGILAMLFCILLVRYIRYWRVFIYIMSLYARWG